MNCFIQKLKRRGKNLLDGSSLNLQTNLKTSFIFWNSGSADGRGVKPAMLDTVRKRKRIKRQLHQIHGEEFTLLDVRGFLTFHAYTNLSACKNKFTSAWKPNKITYKKTDSHYGAHITQKKIHYFIFQKQLFYMTIITKHGERE